MAQRHNIPLRIHDSKLQIHPPILNQLRLAPAKQPLNAPLRQQLLKLNIQQHRRVPVDPQRLLSLLRILAIIPVLPLPERLHGHGKHIRNEPQRLVRDLLPGIHAHPLIPDTNVRLSGPGEVELQLGNRLPEAGERHLRPALPVLVLVFLQLDEVYRRRHRVQLEACVERKPLLGVQVGLGEVGDNLLAALRHGDVDDGGLAAELGVGHFEAAGALLRAAQEVGVEGDGVGLILRFESSIEV